MLRLNYSSSSIPQPFVHVGTRLCPVPSVQEDSHCTFAPFQGVIRRLSDGQLKFFLLASAQPVGGSQRNRPILPASNLLRDNGSAVMTNTSNSESSWMLVETQDSGLSPNYLVPAPLAVAIASEAELTAETSVGCDSTVSLLSLSPRPVQKLALEAIVNNTKEKFKCELCGEVVEWTRQHIYGRHLKAKNLFECAKCTFSSGQHAFVVRRHGLDVHHDRNVVVSRLAQHAQKFDQLFRKCFPLVPPPPMEEMTGSGNVQQSERDELSSPIKSANDGGKRQWAHGRLSMRPAKKLPPSTKKRNKKLPSTPMVKKERKMCKSKTVVCSLCHKSMSVHNRKPHVLLKHLCAEDMFQCSLCDYRNSSSPKPVRLHIASRHAGSSATVVSRESGHLKLYNTLRNQCFPQPCSKK